MFICPYCGNTSMELVPCCGEVHSEEISDEELEWLDATGAELHELRDKRYEFEQWMEQQIALQPKHEDEL